MTQASRLVRCRQPSVQPAGSSLTLKRHVNVTLYVSDNSEMNSPIEVLSLGELKVKRSKVSSYS